MNIMVSGGFIDSNGQKTPFYETKNPPENILLEFLSSFRENSGFLSMLKINCDDIGPQSLQVYSESGRFMLLLGVIDEDGEHGVKTLENPDATSGLAIMHGESYPAKAIVNDFEPIISVCREFLNTGNILSIQLDY